MRTMAILLLLASTALAAHPSPIVVVGHPWDGTTPVVLPSSTNPLAKRHNFGGAPQTGGDLYLLGADGGPRELLVDSGPDGNIAYPHVAFDGQAVVYAKRVTLNGTYDIYSLNLATRQETRITGPNQGNNICPCPLGPQLHFASDRDGFRNNGQGPVQSCFLLFACDLDGKNVERTHAAPLGSALLPEPYVWGGKTMLMYGTSENMGARSVLTWKIEASQRDGTGFEPFISGYNVSITYDFAFQIPGTSKMGAVAYYGTSARNGTGAIIEANPFPQGSPAPPPRFVSTGKTDAAGTNLRQEFMTAESRGLTQFTHHGDSFSTVIGGISQGFVAHPSAAAGGLLLTWTGPDTPIMPGPQMAALTRHRLAKLVNYQPATNADQLEILADDPALTFSQPREVAARSVPTLQPWLPNDGTKCPALLVKGTPYALIGSASTRNRDWIPDSDTVQGGQIPAAVNDADIAYVSLYAGLPSPLNGQPFEGWLNERLVHLADVPVNHPRPDSTSPLDGHGQPDTSWAAIVLGDTPIIEAVKNPQHEIIAWSRTWKPFRPGTTEIHCGGCHKHTGGGVALESTLMHRSLFGTRLVDDPPFNVTDATKASEVLQLERDIQPILTANGLTASVYRGAARDITGAPQFNALPGVRLRSTLYTTFPGTAGDKAKVGRWIDTGACLGPGTLADDLHPTLTVQSPNREQSAPITEIRFGAADLHGGPVTPSVKASFVVSGRPAQSELADLFTKAGEVWSLAIPAQASGVVTVTATDTAGNAESVTRTFAAAAPPTLEEQIAALKAEIAALKAQGSKDAATITALKALRDQLHELTKP